ncbi:MAG TPA: hypothetical protein EYP35_00885 [Desulfobacterales bacterium]|nr:hypothetical protein [Desulfobacterales bacterium]
MVTNKGAIMGKIVIVSHSGFGHTKLQAELVHRGATAVEGTEAVFFTTSEAIEKMDELDSADGIIFGCPTYMGNISAGMKQFLEEAVKFSGDKLNTLFRLVVNAMQHGMIFVGTAMFPSAQVFLYHTAPLHYCFIRCRPGASHRFHPWCPIHGIIFLMAKIQFTGVSHVT